MNLILTLTLSCSWGGKSGRKHFKKNQMDSSQMWGCLHMEKVVTLEFFWFQLLEEMNVLTCFCKGNKKKTKPQVKNAPDSKHANSKDELASVTAPPYNLIFCFNETHKYLADSLYGMHLIWIWYPKTLHTKHFFMNIYLIL